jgi:hypothetical protein
MDEMNCCMISDAGVDMPKPWRGQIVANVTQIGKLLWVFPHVAMFR